MVIPRGGKSHRVAVWQLQAIRSKIQKYVIAISHENLQIDNSMFVNGRKW